MQLNLYCDESGRLGYSDRGEYKAGEISVVAGAILHSENAQSFSNYSSSLLKKFTANQLDSRKFHITDLPESMMLELREDVFGYIHRNDIPIVYGAIYHEALARQFRKIRAANNFSATKLNKEGFTISKNLTQFIKLSQSESFYCMYIKTACTLVEVFDQPVEINVITDEVDEKTLKAYQKQIERVHNQNSHPPLTGKRYNKKTGEKEAFIISSLISENSNPIAENLALSKGKVFKQQASNSIVADVIANSVHHHLRSFAIETKFGPLNSSEAIKSHPLSSHFIATQTTAFDIIHPYTEASSP